MVIKKILIVCRSFYPDISPRSFRATELAKEFARQGHEVTVLLPKNGRNYSEFEKEYSVRIKDIGKLRLKEVELKGKGLELLLRRAVRRILKLLFEYPDIELMFKVARALKHERGYDLLISIAVPHPIHWGVARVWKKGYKIAKTWVADCGDPYMLARLDSFNKPFYFIYFEKFFCRKCNYISVPFEEMRLKFYEEFRQKIVIIPQGFNLTEINKYKGVIKNEKPKFIFAGSIIQGYRDLSSFLDFLITKDKDFQFIVYTKQIGWFENYKNKLKDKLIINEYIDRKSLIYEMSKVDFLVNIDTKFDGENNIEAIPSKLIDYAIAGRPILNLNSSNLDAEKVNEFLEGNYSKARKIDISRYDIENVTKQFLELL